MEGLFSPEEHISRLHDSVPDELQKELKVAEESIVYITDSAIERIPMWYKCFFAEENFIIAVPKLVKVCEEDSAELQLIYFSNPSSGIESFPQQYHCEIS